MDKCVNCEGTGKVNCKTCNGEGKIACPTCGGSGREISVCPTCTKGYVPDPRSFDDEPTLKCPDCHGEWQKDAGPCKKCNGTGYVRPCSDCNETGTKVCTICKGTGEFDVTAFCRQLIDIAGGKYPQLHEDKITADIIPIIQDAADNGNGLAAFVMGKLFVFGFEIGGRTLVTCDPNKTREYFRKGAEAGDALAQGMYGYLLYHGGMGVVVDKASGYQWLVKAGENGNIGSLYLLAIDGYIYGKYGHDRDLVKSLECFNKILNVKDKDAWYQGYISSARGYVEFLPKIISNDTQAMLALSDWILSLGNKYVESIGFGGPPDERTDSQYWLLQAAKAGNVEAIKEYEDWKWNEFGEDVGVVANEWYKKAADHGDAAAQSIYGEHLRTGSDIKADYAQALIYLYQAAEQGKINAIRRLAHMYRDGDYVEKNRRKANELYVRAAKSGDGWSLYEIGNCYLKGEYVKKDEKEAKRLLKLAEEEGIKASKEGEEEGEAIDVREKARKALAAIPDSVKEKDKGPSGIVVGEPDKGALPKFAKIDYENAKAGRPAAKSSSKKGASSVAGEKKRWKFVVLGLLFGFFGIHLAYAKRWFLFLLLWAGFITGNVMSGSTTDAENVPSETAAQQVQSAGKPNEGDDNPISGIGFGVWALLWIGGTLFIKKDGKGNRM